MEKAANINANAKMVQSKCCVARLGANVVDTVYPYLGGRLTLATVSIRIKSCNV